MVNYDNLPETKRNDKYFWISEIKSLDLIDIFGTYDKMPPGLFTPKEQRSHWLEALERDHYAVLFHYDKIPQGIFTTEEQRMHWREMSEKDSRWIGAFDKFPEGLFSLEERQGYWKERLLEIAKEGMDWRLLSHYDKVK